MRNVGKNCPRPAPSLPHMGFLQHSPQPQTFPVTHRSSPRKLELCLQGCGPHPCPPWGIHSELNSFAQNPEDGKVRHWGWQTLGCISAPVNMANGWGHLSSAGWALPLLSPSWGKAAGPSPHTFSFLPSPPHSLSLRDTETEIYKSPENYEISQGITFPYISAELP